MMNLLRTYRTLIPALVLAGTVFACNGKNENSADLPPVETAPYEVDSTGGADPIAVDGASKGGTFNLWGGPFPKTLNSWLDNWGTTAEINNLMFHALIDLHSVREEPVGDLASQWNRGADGKTFTFTIHPDAQWSDGKPVTAADVQFYYDVIMNPKHLTTIPRSIVDRFERPEIVDEKTVKIVAKEKHWRAFWDAGGFYAFPKHVWEGQDFNEINFDFPVVNGPYKIREFRRNRFVLLERRGDWWARARGYNQNKFNFDYIRYKFMEDRTAALEAFKKGDYDMYAIYTASIWAEQTQNIEAVQKNHIVRQAAYNKQPLGFQGLAVNMRLDKFADPRVREALTRLIDLPLMNEKLMFNEYFLLNSFFPDLYPNNQNPAVPVVRFDPAKARELLDEAGWTVGPGGKRQKDGQPLSVTFLTYASDQRHLNLYIEDLKKAGIDAKIELRSKAEVTKRTDSFQFDIFWINTGASRLRDPEPIFHSRYADLESSYNLAGVKDEQVDGILEKLKFETNLDRRNAMLKQLDARLLELTPFVLLWQADKTRLLYWNKFGTPEYVINKYARENSALVYWWYDKQKQAALETAIKDNSDLPAEPAEVVYKGP